MKHNTISANRVLSAALLVLAFGAFMGAQPSTAAAWYNNGYTYDYNYYGYPDSYCPPPQIAQVAPNGYYTCAYPSAPAQPVVYPQPIVYQQPALTATCYANTTSVPTGTGVQWTATASGGYGSYTYTWYGSDGLSGYGQTTGTTYYYPGTKTASVVVASGGQSVTVNCGNTVNVYGYQTAYQPIYQQTTYVQPQPIVTGPTVLSTNVSGLDIGCYSDPANAIPNQPVTWNVEVTGGVAPYKYSWTGSDGLTGSSATVVKYYQTGGPKSALVTVTSADGRSQTKACSNAVAISSYRSTVAVRTTPAPTPAATAPSNANLSAGALFSLGNVPWGWVAILVILVLFIACMYLVFNKPKM